MFPNTSPWWPGRWLRSTRSFGSGTAHRLRPEKLKNHCWVWNHLSFMLGNCKIHENWIHCDCWKPSVVWTLSDCRPEVPVSGSPGTPGDPSWVGESAEGATADRRCCGYRYMVSERPKKWCQHHGNSCWRTTAIVSWHSVHLAHFSIRLTFLAHLLVNLQMSRLRVELCCEVLIAQYPQMKSMQRTSAPAVRHGHYPEDGSRGRKMELWQTMRKLAVLRCQEYHHGSKLLRPWAAPPCLPQPNPADRRIGQKKTPTSTNFAGHKTGHW